MSVVSAQGLSLTYPGNIEALKNVDLSIEAGEFVSFIGPSGCGKTTLLRVVADLEQPTGGTVLVTGQTPEQARQARAYGYVFQQPGLLPWRTVEGNIFLPLALMGQKRAEAAGRIADVLKMVHPKPETPSRKALYGYLIGKAHDAEALPQLVRDFEA
ncbi:MAG: ATP-binding cassette domain-containing protein, partial [Alphaproteobacteria bacterium]